MGMPATMACGGQGAKVVVVELVDWDDPKNNKWWSIWMNIWHRQWTIQGWIQGWPVNSVKSRENDWQSSRPAMFFCTERASNHWTKPHGDISPMWSGQKSGVARSPLRCRGSWVAGIHRSAHSHQTSRPMSSAAAAFCLNCLVGLSVSTLAQISSDIHTAH